MSARVRGTLAGHRLLLDTNILLDILIKERPQSKEACRVLERCNGEGDMGLTCPLSLKDVYYVLTKLQDETRARACIEALMSTIVIAPVSAEECELSVRGDEPDFEDGLVRIAVELNDVDFIITRDATAFSRSTVRPLPPAEYLELFDGD